MKQINMYFSCKKPKDFTGPEMDYLKSRQQFPQQKDVHHNYAATSLVAATATTDSMGFEKFHK